MKIIIWTPEYSERSGGVVVLHKLCHLLRQKGEDAYVTSNNGPSNMDCPNISGDIDVDEDVVIYPEIYNGNPAGVKKVVRWLLNKPGVMGGNGVYQDTDWIYHFSSVFYDKRSRGQLTVYHLFDDFYKPPEE